MILIHCMLLLIHITTSILDPVPIINMKISTREIQKEIVIVEGDFKMTKAVRERMQKLCGATNYSLGLRSSEHAARYLMDYEEIL